jgi:amidase
MNGERASAGDGIIERSAVELVEAIAAKALSATEIVGAYMRRLETVNPLVNAVCTIDPGALEAAAQCDRRLAGGQPVRPLEGVPFVVKDVIETRGLRTTFGSLEFAQHVPGEDAVAVERLRAAGAILLGKANTPEFASDVYTANALFGATRNPWDLNTTSGGSSGGTGAALAADIAPIGLGTDFGGSIRIPSAFCGTVGLRPVPGRVPIHPGEFAWDTLVEHVQGPMARHVADLGLMLSVLAGPDDRDPSSLPAQHLDFAAAARTAPDLAGRRVVFSVDLDGLVPVDPQVAALATRAAQRFESLGCAVTEEGFDASGLREIIGGTRAFAMIARHADRLERDAARLSPTLARQISEAMRFDARAIAQAERLRSTYWHRVRRLFERCDYVLTPTVGVPAFRVDQPLPSRIGARPITHFSDTFMLTYAFSITGLPVVSVPCGLTSDGLPVGLQIVGPRLREDRVLEAAAAYTAAYPLEPARAVIRTETMLAPAAEVLSSGFPIR